MKGAALHIRLRAGIVVLPPLRHRLEEMPFVIKQYCGDLGISAEFAEACLLHDWPGNVRELIAIVQMAAVFANASKGRSLTAEDFRAALGVAAEEQAAAVDTKQSRKPRDPEKRATFERVLRETNSIAAAKAATGISLSTAYEWAKEIEKR